MSVFSIINQALAYGFTAAQVVGVLTKKNARFSKPISQALAEGFTPEQVLTYLGRSGAMRGSKQDIQEAEHFNNSYTKYLENTGVIGKDSVQGHRAKNIASNALHALPPILATAGAIYAANRGSGAIHGQILPPLPPGPANPVRPNAKGLPHIAGSAGAKRGIPSSIPNQPSGSPPVSPNPPPPGVPPAPSPQSPSGGRQPPTPTPVSPPSFASPKPKDVLDQLGVSQVVANMAKAGNEVPQIAAALQFITSPSQRKALKGIDLPAIIEQFIAEQPQEKPPEVIVPSYQQKNPAQAENQQEEEAASVIPSQKIQSMVEPKGLQEQSLIPTEFSLPESIGGVPTNQYAPPQEDEEEYEPEAARAPSKEEQTKKDVDHLKFLRLSSLAKELDKKGYTPEQIAKRLFEVSSEGEKRDLSRMDIVEAVKGLLSEKPSEKPLTEEQKKLKEEQEALKAKFAERYGAPKKGEIASTVNGIVGEIKSLSSKEALIEDDGKIHKVPVDQIETPDIAAYHALEYLKGIPEDERSGPVALFTRNPSNNDITIQFHSGASYHYYNVDSEKINKIANKLAIPITKGQNIFGEWSQNDKKSLGAAFDQAIKKDPKYSKENEGKTWIKLETPYDYHYRLRTKYVESQSPKPPKKPRSKKPK